MLYVGEWVTHAHTKRHRAICKQKIGEQNFKKIIFCWWNGKGTVNCTSFAVGLKYKNNKIKRRGELAYQRHTYQFIGFVVTLFGVTGRFVIFLL